MSLKLLIHLIHLFMFSFADESVQQLSLPFSESIKSFWSNSVVGRSVQIVLDPQSVTSEENFVNVYRLNEENQMRCATFVVGSFASEIEGEDAREDGYYSVDRSENVPSLQLLRISHTHLYFIDEEYDLKAAIKTQFINFVVRKENPKYIVLWSNNPKANIRWMKYFSKWQFYQLFMDYRTLVNWNTKTGSYDIHVICMVCISYSSSYTETSILSVVSSSDKQSVTKLWSNFNSNFHREGIEWSFAHGSQDRIWYKKKADLPRAFAHSLNATLMHNDGEHTITHRFVTEIYPLTPSHIKRVFFRKGKRSLQMVNSYIDSVGFEMFTVTRTTSLLRGNWKTMFAPLRKESWAGVCVLALVVLGLLSRVSAKHTAFQLIHIMAVLAPMTDHWYELSKVPYVRALMNIWAVFCFSTTILYGGELASSLTVLPPPAYPRNLQELCKTSPSIISQAEIFSSRGEMSYLAYSIDKFLNSTTANREFSKCLAHIAKEATKSYCPSENRLELSIDKVGTPILCNTSSKQITYNRPITFVDIETNAFRSKLMFKSLSGFWLSKTHSFPLFRYVRPILSEKNYFAILLNSFVSAWITGGLQTHTESIVDASGKRNYFWKLRSLSTSNENNFDLVQGQGLLTIAPIFYIFFGMAIVVFIFETIPLLTKIHSQIGRTKQTKSITTFSF